MKSPFPGMDPYLERHWRDVHATLIVLSRAAIQPQLGSGLRARIEERLVVEAPVYDETREIYPDVRVFEHGLSDRPVVPTATAVAEPLVVQGKRQKVPQRFIEIIDLSGDRVVSIIEFVSPSNKLSGEARDKYLEKRDERTDAHINFVEIDLTRAGKRVPMYPEVELPAGYDTPYFACAKRGLGYDQYELYAIPLRKRLPAIRIPLRETDPDVVLDLQPLIDRAYAEGAYDDIDYRKPCVPPLDGEDAAWADELLKTAGKR